MGWETIVMDESRIILDRRPGAYVPGEAIRGRVDLSAMQGCAVVAEVQLVRQIRGKGHGADEIVARRGIDVVGLSASFELAAPASPYSFSGRLISVGWMVRLALLRDMPTGPADGGMICEVEIVIAPRRSEILLFAGEQRPGRTGV